jgi:hypothetical protein
VANKIWSGNAKNVAQVNTITPTAQNSETYTVTINGKTVSYLSDASATVAEITAGLVSALSASTAPPEFAEVTWTDSTTLVTATAVTAGKPFTQTSSATGAATLVTVTTTANKSSNDWNDADNWSPTGVPVSTDDVFLENIAVSILYGLAQSAVTLTSLNIAASFTGMIGLPKHTGLYYEYRADYLAIGATTLNVGSGPGNGSSRLKVNTGSVQTTLNVFATAAGAESGLEALLWRGTHASNVVNITRGSLGVAVFGGETATILTVRCGYQQSVTSDVSMRCGTGVTLTTVEKSGGDLTVQSNSTTINHVNGTLTILAGTVTTLNVDGGTVYYQSSGTVTILNVGDGAKVDFSRDMRARTVSACNLYSGGAISDPYKTVTWTAGIDLERTTLQDVSLALGENIKITPAAVT